MSWTRIDFNPRPKRSDLQSMRALGVRDVMVYCGNPPRCYHQARLNLDDWHDDVIFGDLERRMVCTVCGHLGADMPPRWDNWKLAS
jgi:hypothetical protein